MENKETAIIVEDGKGLMRKTKAQLVEIIMRKDDVERKLRKDIKIKDDNYNKAISEKEYAQEQLKDIREDYNVLQNDYQNECDENVSKQQEIADKCNLYKLLSIISIMFAVIEFVLLVIIL